MPFRLVDEQVLKILNRRKIECFHYWGPVASANYKCAKEESDLEDASTNYFIKCMYRKSDYRNNPKFSDR